MSNESTVKHEVLIVNAIISTSTGNPQLALCRIRGDWGPEADGRTVKVPISLFADGCPLPSEAYLAEFAANMLQDAGPRYRVLRNAKLRPAGP